LELKKILFLISASFEEFFRYKFTITAVKITQKDY